MKLNQIRAKSHKFLVKKNKIKLMISSTKHKLTVKGNLPPK